MIKSITVVNRKGEELLISLSDPLASGLAVSNITGLGPVKASISTTSYASRDGAVFNSARVDVRNIVLSMIFVSSENELIETIRQRTYRYFPVKEPITLKFVTDNRECTIDGYVESNEPEIFNRRESTQISIICPDPYFYDSSTSQKVSFLGKTGIFHFPFANEGTDTETVIMGEITRRLTKSFIYDGEGQTGVVIMLDFLGEVGGKITIENKTTKQKMVIDTSLFSDSYKLKKDDRIWINTNPGNKYVRLVKSVNGTSSSSINILNCIASGSVWIEIVHGENDFAVTADSGQENIDVSVRTVVRYEGL